MDRRRRSQTSHSGSVRSRRSDCASVGTAPQATGARHSWPGDARQSPQLSFWRSGSIARVPVHAGGPLLHGCWPGWTAPRHAAALHEQSGAAIGRAAESSRLTPHAQHGSMASFFPWHESVTPCAAQRHHFSARGAIRAQFAKVGRVPSCGIPRVALRAPA